LPVIQQEGLVLRVRLGAADDSQWIRGILPKAKFIELDEYADDLFQSAPQSLAKPIGAFLKA
jgi:hypothetical protein